MTVSGSVEYDTLKRVIQQGQPGYNRGGFLQPPSVDSHIIPVKVL